MSERVFPSIRDALAFLDARPPKVEQGMTQADLDARVAEWKENELEKARQGALFKYHPDRGGNAADFSRATAAYKEIRDHLRVRVPAARVVACTKCSAQRLPVDARFCGRCGDRYDAPPPVVCPCCATDLHGVGCFCTTCGWQYAEDPLVAVLVAAGLARHKARETVTSGRADALRGLSPTSSTFEMYVRALLLSNSSSYRVFP